VAEEDQEKTEEPTPHKIQEAIKRLMPNRTIFGILGFESMGADIKRPATRKRISRN